MILDSIEMVNSEVWLFYDPLFHSVVKYDEFAAFNIMNIVTDLTFVSNTNSFILRLRMRKSSQNYIYIYQYDSHSKLHLQYFWMKHRKYANQMR